MGIYIEKQVTVYGEGYGVRFRACEGGDLCCIVLVKEDGVEDGEGVLLNWDVAKSFAEAMMPIAGERA